MKCINPFEKMNTDAFRSKELNSMRTEIDNIYSDYSLKYDSTSSTFTCKRGIQNIFISNLENYNFSSCSFTNYFLFLIDNT